MSQYPYQPPQQQQQQPTSYGYGYYPQDPMAALLAPARRASVILLVLAAPMVLCGVLMGLFTAMLKSVDAGKLPAEQAAQFQALEQQLAPMGISLAGAATFFAVASLVLGVLLLVLGVVVRRGGMGAAVGSIIVCCLLGLFAVLSVFGGITQAAQGQGQALLGSCIWGGVLVLLIVALVSLFQVARNAGQVAAYRGGMGGYPQPYPQGYGPPQQQAPLYPSQQPQSWQQPGAGPWGQQQMPPPPGWGQQGPPMPPPPPSDRQG